MLDSNLLQKFEYGHEYGIAKIGKKQLELSLCIEVMHGVFPHHVKRCTNHMKIYGRHFEWSE